MNQELNNRKQLRRVLFVCTGNICRSSTAEGVARVLAEKAGFKDHFTFDSAGTHSYHVGDPPDPRSIASAKTRGYDLSTLRARRVTEFDFVTFDLLLAMDNGHLQYLQRAAPATHRGKVRLFLEFVDEDLNEVPDPYYGDSRGFEQVLDLIEMGCRRLLLQLADAS